MKANKVRLINIHHYVLTFDFENNEDFLKYIVRNKKKFFDIDIKLHKEGRTITQNNFFHLLCDYIAHQLGMSPALIKQGIKEIYGYKHPNPFNPAQLVAIPTSECNKFEEMTANIEGLFIEAGEQGIDMRDFIIQWQKIRMARKMNNG